MVGLQQHCDRSKSIHSPSSQSLYKFVDPSTLVHTQNIENMWMYMKRKKKAQMGQHVSLLGSHLIEFLWRRRFGERPFENLVRCIQDKYPV